MKQKQSTVFNKKERKKANHRICQFWFADNP